MDRQLHLLSNDDTRTGRQWRLDAETRAVGRKGLAQARAALRAAARRVAQEPAPVPRTPSQSSSRARRPAA